MQNALFKIQDGYIMIDQAQATTYGIAAVAAVILVVLVTIAIKSRRKDFIRTIPTNLKSKY